MERMTSRRTKISPKTGRGLGHVTPTIFGSTVGYPSDSLASCTAKGTSLRECTSFEPFCVKSVGGLTSRGGPEKSQKVSDSHGNDVSPLTQGLRYRAACDVKCHT